jgi:hypothetical protein
MRYVFLSMLLAAGMGVPSLAQAPEELQKRLDEAQRSIVRLRPADFRELPANLVRELERRKCTIPQQADAKLRNNVVRGEFARPGQRDWAILCSVDGYSSILLFWKGSENNPGEIARAEDRNFLQGIGGEKIGFSREISAVGKDFIMKHYRAYGGPTPPPVNHQGIDDAFVGKGSITYYYHEEKWYQLTGSD